MATGSTLAGRGSARIDGKVYNCTKIDPQPGTEKREKLVGLGGVSGDKVTPQAPTVALTIIVSTDVNITALGLLQNVLVEIEMADGRNYLFAGASVAEPPTHSATDGTADVKFEAVSCLEV